MAEQDKQRYNTEKSQYTGPWVVPSENTRKVRETMTLIHLRTHLEFGRADP
jgi:hypothetical protein